MSWSLLLNSLASSLLATTGALALGSIAALCWLASGPRLRRFLTMTAILVLMLPPFLVADCWLALLGHEGSLRGIIPCSIYSLGGASWLLALLYWPLPAFAVAGALMRLGNSLLEAEPDLSGGLLAQHLLWPAAKAGLLHSGLVVFVLTFNQFTIPSILQVKVFPAEFYVRFSTTWDYMAAMQTAIPMILLPLAGVWWLSTSEFHYPPVKTAGYEVFRQRLGSALLWFCRATTAITFALAAAVPLVFLLWGSVSGSSLVSSFHASAPTLGWSLFFGATVASLSAAGGLLFHRKRLGWWVWIPFFTPGVLIGLAMILVFNHDLTGLLYSSPIIVVLALCLRYFVVGWGGSSLARRSAGTALTDMVHLETSHRWTVFRHAEWPQILPQVCAAWYATYLLCLWDLETLLLIIPPGIETASLRIFNLLHYGHNPEITALTLWLVGLAMVPAILYLGWGALGRQLSGSGWLGRRSVVLGGVSLCLLLPGCSPKSPSSRELNDPLFARVDVIGSRGTNPGQLNKPRSVTVDADDNLYVVDMTGRVQKFSSTGVFLKSWQLPQTDLGKPKGMCLDQDGRITVLEPHYSRVNSYARDGTLLHQWGRKGTNSSELSFPRAIAVNPQGQTFLSEYGVVERVQLFSAGGSNWVKSIGTYGKELGQFNRPEGLGLDAQGNLHVADSCNHRIQILSPTLEAVESYGEPGSGIGQLGYPYDVKIDATGMRFVCEFGNSRIQVFDTRGKSSEIIGCRGTAPGEFSNPWGVALDSCGNLYVADAGNHRVQKLTRRHPLSGSTRPAGVANGKPIASGNQS